MYNRRMHPLLLPLLPSWKIKKNLPHKNVTSTRFVGLYRELDNQYEKPIHVPHNTAVNDCLLNNFIQ